MNETLQHITLFLNEHHLLNLATSHQNIPQISSAFYVFDEVSVSFIIASSHETEHIQNIVQNPYVAVSVALETDSVGKIQGLQCKAQMVEVNNAAFMKTYLKKFPYASMMKPTLWQIKILQMKFTDNRLGFGKKLMWMQKTSD
jgi:hypothetical protein